MHKVKAINEKLYTCFQMMFCSRQNNQWKAEEENVSVETNEEKEGGGGGGGECKKKAEKSNKNEKLNREKSIKSY